MLDLFINFFHNFKPQPIFLRLGFFNIYWYPFLIVLGLVLGYIITLRLSRSLLIKRDLLDNLFLFLVIFGFIGARLYHIFSEFPYYLRHPWEIFAVWQGGLGIFGAIVAGVIVLYFFAKKYRLSFFILADLLSPALVLGQAIGRWGNYFNQEVFGKPTNLPWGIPVSFSLKPNNFLSANYFHPTFLYESLANFLIFFVLLFTFNKVYFGKCNLYKNQGFKKEIYIKANDTGQAHKVLNSGKIFAFYLILYSIVRFLMEFLRIDFQPELWGLRLGQVFAIFVFISGVLILFHKTKKFSDSANKFNP